MNSILKTAHFSTKKKTYTKGFTLIELMVVMSIVAMLSSVIIVALQGARNKGVVASGLNFATYNYHFLGADALAIYNFNDLLNSTNVSTSDGGPNNYNATLVGCGSSPFCKSTLTPTGTGSSFVLAGGQYAAYDQNTNLSKSNLTSATESVWIYPTTVIASGNYEIVMGVSDLIHDIGSHRNLYLDIRGPGNILHAQSAPDSGSGCSFDLTGVIQLNKWQNITFSVNGGTGSLYLNGKLLQTQSGCTGMNFMPKTILIGTYNTTPLFPFTGNIDDASVYSSALSDAQVKEIYAQGLPSHLYAKK